MRRREFIAASAALIVAPPRSRAQGKPRRIGFLAHTPPLSDPASKRIWDAFLEGLRQYGWVEGQNLLIEGRWVEGILNATATTPQSSSRAATLS